GLRAAVPDRDRPRMRGGAHVPDRGPAREADVARARRVGRRPLRVRREDARGSAVGGGPAASRRGPAAGRAVTERLAPERPFPPYAFVSPHRPHPRTDPRGHSFGAPETPAPPLNPAEWRRSRDYLHAIDLFNHGYYWEAHEAWEAL